MRSQDFGVQAKIPAQMVRNKSPDLAADFGIGAAGRTTPARLSGEDTAQPIEAGPQCGETGRRWVAAGVKPIVMWVMAESSHGWRVDCPADGDDGGVLPIRFSHEVDSLGVSVPGVAMECR